MSCVASLTAKTFRFRAIIDALLDNRVEFVLVGGLAGVVHGSSYVTYDVDISCPGTPANLRRLAAALRDLGAFAELDDSPRYGIETDFGRLDVLFDLPYRKLRESAVSFDLEGSLLPVASLDHLIAAKEALGRTKDRLMATEYRVLSNELRAPMEESS